MRPKVFMSLIVLAMCVLCVVPMMLMTTNISVRSEESSVVEVAYTSRESASQPVTAGVLMGAAADAYGWTNLPNGEDALVETALGGNRVLVVDQLNNEEQAEVTLAQAVRWLRDLDANPIFVASDLVASSEERLNTADYPDVVVVQNVAQREAVARMLAAVSGDAYDGVRRAPGMSDTIEIDDDIVDRRRSVMVGFFVLTALLGVGMWLALRVSRSSQRAREPAADDDVPPKRKRRRSGSIYHARRSELETRARVQMNGFPAPERGALLLHDLSTYILGDQQFDDAFPLERAEGDFLGDFGLQISAYVNRYNPDKVTALRLWLFDAHDLSTAAALLASEDAHKDAESRAPLAQQNSTLHLAEEGAVITLETATLQLQARVLDMRYGFADTLALNSFFDHVVVEIAVYEKA